jgi:hypothetical protein
MKTAQLNSSLVELNQYDATIIVIYHCVVALLRSGRLCSTAKKQRLTVFSPVESRWGENPEQSLYDPHINSLLSCFSCSFHIFQPNLGAMKSLGHPIDEKATVSGTATEIVTIF